MAATIAVEEEFGTGTGRVSEHNGYYAGDFWRERQAPLHSVSTQLEVRGLGATRRPLVR